MKKITVITINYNDAAGLQKTVASVAAQDFGDFEYIVIDGGSNDDSVNVIERNQGAVSSYVSEKDDGIYDAMNKGIARASGEYLLFLNSGDMLESGTVLSQVAPFLNGTKDIVYGNMKISHKGELSDGFMPDEISAEHMVRDTLWHPVSFIRRELFDRFGYYDVTYKIVADYDFFFKTLIVHRVSRLHVPIFISVFDLGGKSSDPGNRLLIAKERRKVLSNYLKEEELVEYGIERQKDFEDMVSIIIPAYNYARFIQYTLQSVKDQVFENFECLIIDNGSTDDTISVVAPFLQDKRFRYVRQENVGVSRGRNRGLQLARGRYIQFLDADDLIEPYKLLQSVNYLRAHASCDIVYTDVRYFTDQRRKEFFFSRQCDRENDRPWMTYMSGQGKEVVALLLRGNNFVISAPLYDRSKVGRYFDDTLNYNEDWDFWLQSVLEGAEIHFLDSPGTRSLIRVHRESASDNVFAMQLSGLRVLLKNSAAVADFGFAAELKRRISEHKRVIRKMLLQSRGEVFSKRVRQVQEQGLTASFLIFPSGPVFIRKLGIIFKQLL